MSEGRRWPRIIPDSLVSGILTLFTAVVILMAASTLFYMFVTRNDASVLAATSQAADQIIAIKRIIDGDEPPDRLVLIRRLSSPTMRMAITPVALVDQSDDTWSTRYVLNRFQRELPDGTEVRVQSHLIAASASPEAALERGGDEPPNADLRGGFSGREGARGEGRGQRDGPPESLTPEERQMRQFTRMKMDEPRLFPSQGSLRVSIKFGDAWFNVRVLLNTGTVPTRRGPITFLSFMSLLVGIGALVAVSRAFRPLKVFAGAAERLGVDVNAPPLDESGPREVRKAAMAFNHMQQRLKRFIQDRTQMLAAISHDLRTPITRMRLRAEFVDDDEQRDKMLNDLDEMEQMIAATLAFARDDAANESIKNVDIARLLAEIAADTAAAGHDAAYTGPEHLEIIARPLALKRAVGNLVDNAVKYGVRARIDLRKAVEGVEILIDDDGPGIPDEEQERVFGAFVRLEGSRSRETGGAGLGLTIARNIVRGMGGDVEIASKADKGLRLRVFLPITAPARGGA